MPCGDMDLRGRQQDSLRHAARAAVHGTRLALQRPLPQDARGLSQVPGGEELREVVEGAAQEAVGRHTVQPEPLQGLVSSCGGVPDLDGGDAARGGPGMGPEGEGRGQAHLWPYNKCNAGEGA